MIDVTREEFEALVGEALDEIPEEFQAYLDNTLVRIEEEPSPAELQLLRIRKGSTLLGLYTGTPLTRRDANFAALPDTIHLYRRPILRACRTRAEVIQQIRETVVHEIGHFFGLSDADLP